MRGCLPDTAPSPPSRPRPPRRAVPGEVARLDRRQQRPANPLHQRAQPPARAQALRGLPAAKALPHALAFLFFSLSLVHG